MVYIGADRIVIHSVAYEELIKEKERKSNSVGIIYPDKGYMPIPEYRNEKGNVVLDQESVLRLWAELVKERMKAVFPDSVFDEFISTYYRDGKFDGLYFHYQLPPLHWKKWF